MINKNKCNSRHSVGNYRKLKIRRKFLEGFRDERVHKGITIQLKDLSPAKIDSIRKCIFKSL